jgi:hypothetical protein
MKTSDVLQTFLASGIIAAVVGAAVSAAIGFLILIWQRRQSAASAKAAARVIYLEIALNINMLAAGSRGNPPQFLVSRRAWDARFADLLGLLKEYEIGAVAAPYVQLDAFEHVFRQGPDDLWQSRLVGDDQRLLRQLLDQFRVAESVLRPKVWSEKRAKALKDAISQVPIPEPSTRAQRVKGFFGSLPLWRLIEILGFMLLMRVLLELRDAIRQR